MGRYILALDQGTTSSRAMVVDEKGGIVASAQRGNERVIATVFGGKSTTSRNARVAELLDLGFRRAPSSAPLRKPAPPVYASNPSAAPGAAGKTIRVSGAVAKSLRPVLRPEADPVLIASADPAPPDPSSAWASTRASSEVARTTRWWQCLEAKPMAPSLRPTATVL